MIRRGFHRRTFAIALAAIAIAVLIGGIAMPDDAQVRAEVYPPLPGGWVLIFEDEFEGTTLDTSKWLPEWGWGRESTTYPECYFNPDNIVVNNGVVELYAKNDGATYNGTNYPYTCAAMVTGYHLFNYNYGYAEVRAKMPYSRGFWPAFWQLNPDGVWPPEIDTMEFLSHQPNTVYVNYHWGKKGPGTRPYYQMGAFPVVKPFNYYDDFHTFGVLWDPGRLEWYVDGELVTYLERSEVEQLQDIYLLLNNVACGAWLSNENACPDETTVWPGVMTVDYVRVWQRDEGAPTATPTTPPAPTDTPVPPPTNTPGGPTDTPAPPTDTPPPTQNKVQNPGFETGVITPWTTSSGSVVDFEVHSGNYAFRVEGFKKTLEQVVVDLSPNTAYIFSGYAKVANAGDQITLGVKDYNGREGQLTTHILTTTYSQGTIGFTTGDQTTAKIFCYKTGGQGDAYCDDFSIVPQ